MRVNLLTHLTEMVINDRLKNGLKIQDTWDKFIEEADMLTIIKSKNWISTHSSGEAVKSIGEHPKYWNAIKKAANILFETIEKK